MRQFSDLPWDDGSSLFQRCPPSHHEMALTPHLAQASARAPRPSLPTPPSTVSSAQVSPYQQRGSTMPPDPPPAPLASYPPHCSMVHRSMGGSDGTRTCHNSTGVKPIAEQGASSYACSFDADCVSTTKAVFVFPLSSNSTKGGSKPGRASSCHRPPVLETAHLASPLVQPAGSIEAEAPPSPSTVLWRVDLCQLGSGQSSSTPIPDQ
jgi:hypothetical protein